LGEATVERHAYARAGLLGNPSDGYFGRALSVALGNFRATVTLEESAELRIRSSPDRGVGVPATVGVYASLDDLIDSVKRHGYQGSGKLVQATIKTFYGHCSGHDIALPARNFTLNYGSSIPRQVGLAGSSAIVTATLRALMAFFKVEIPLERQPTVVLSAEVDELGITAGLQDRVAQVYQGLVYMDLSEDLMEDPGHGAYERLDPVLLPELFVAHRAGSTKVSGDVLDDVRSRWERGDAQVRETLERIAGLATRGRDALLRGDHAEFASFVNDNFDLRRRIMRIDERDLAMVEAARHSGASAKLAGSGGAVVGVYRGREMKDQITAELGALDARVIEPVVALP